MFSSFWKLYKMYTFSFGFTIIMLMMLIIENKLKFLASFGVGCVTLKRPIKNYSNW